MNRPTLSDKLKALGATVAASIARLRERTTPFPDLNGNGVPDYREPWPYKLALRGVRYFVRRQGSPALRSAVELVDGLVREVGEGDPEPTA